MPPDVTTIRIEAEGRIGRLTLNTPATLNALSLTTLRELTAAATWFDSRDDVRVVIVSGEGRAFTAGADLGLFAGDPTVAADPRGAADAGAQMADAVERMRPVTIAAIQGHCVGGGVVLAAACDLRLAEEGTVFSIPEIHLGIPLAWGGIPRLVREVGPAVAKELVMTGRPFSADEAARVGFVNRVVPAGKLRAATDELAAELAAKAKHALLTTKRHVNAVTGQMVGIDRSFADADGLLTGLLDPEARRLAAEYLANRRSGDDAGD